MNRLGSGSTRTAAVALLDQAAVSGTSFLTTVLLVRELGLSTFGVFSLLWLFVLFAVGLERALVSQPMLTIAGKLESADRDRYLGAVFVLQGVYTALCAVVVAAVYGFVLMHWDDERLAGTFAPVVLAVVAKQAHAYVRSSFFARGRRREALANDLVACLGQLGGLAVLWATGRLDLINTLWVVAGASGVATLLGVLRCDERRTSAAALLETAQRHWHFSRWLAAMQAAQFFASNSFLVAAGALLGAGAVGAIKAAHSVVGVLHVVFLSMENVVPGTAARRYVTNGMRGLARYVGHIGVLGLGTTVVVSGILASFPQIVLTPLFGDGVTDDLVLALRALALLYVFGFTIALLQIAFRTLERTRPVFLAYMVNTIVAVLIAEPMVTRFGLAGAVFGMVGQQALMASLLLVTFAVIAGRGTRAPGTFDRLPDHSPPAR